MDSRVFFAGMIIVIVGLLILIYDYPQVIYIQTISIEEMQTLDNVEREKFQRVQSEFYVGIGILTIGAVMLLFSKFPPSMFTKK